MDKNTSRRLEMQDLYLKYDKLEEENKRLKEKLSKLCKDIVSQRIYQKMGMTEIGNNIGVHAHGGFDMCDYLIKENPIIDEILATEEGESR